METQVNFPIPQLVYRRSREYQEISPRPLPGLYLHEALPLDVNLADYWDYLNGIACEAIQASMLGTRPPLRRFSVFLTDLCNLNCDYCRVDRSEARTMDLHWLMDSLPVARKLGVIFFDVMGLGEPTLVPQLPDLLQHASALGFVVTFGTNGATSNLGDDGYLSRLMDVSSIKIRVSLDSANPQQHDLERGSHPTWSKAVGFIERVLRLRAQRNIKASVFINKVVNNINIEDAARDLDFFAELGVDDVHLIPIRRVDHLFCTVDQILRYNTETAPRIREIAYDKFLPWARENAYIFGRDRGSITLASQGIYYHPQIASHCHALRGQLLVDACHHPYTCLWSKRNGGRSLLPEIGETTDIQEIWEKLGSIQYLQISPQVCNELCTREIIQLNDSVEYTLKALQ